MTVHRGHRKPFGLVEGVVFITLILFSAAIANSPVYYGQIEENAPVGSVVAGVVLPLGKWCNETSSGKLKSTLHGQNASDFFLVCSSTTGLVLKTAKSLDRELKSRYLVKTYLCHVNEVKIKIEVLDRNDNPPEFITTKQIIEIDELVPIKTELLRIMAHDADSGKNGDIRFYMLPNPNLHVVPQTGQVLWVRSLPAPGIVDAFVYARDDGDPALLSDPLQLRVSVRSASLTPQTRRTRAVSEEHYYTVTLSEHTRVGDIIFNVPDQKFEEKRFEVLSVEAGSPVRLDPETGRVYLAHELRSSTEVVVKVQNARGKHVLHP